MYGLLCDCTSLKEISFDGWETESLTDMSYLFFKCDSLQIADVSDLDTGNVTLLYRTFYGCGALESIIGLDQWNTSKVVDMQQTFLGVGAKSSAMTEIDISNFDSSSVTVTSFMFNGCTNLETVRFGENWDMAKVTNTNNMFLNCTNLKTIYVAKDWNTDNLTKSVSMFNGCSNLVGGAGTTYKDTNPTDKTYARVDTAENPGYLTLAPAANANP